MMEHNMKLPWDTPRYTLEYIDGFAAFALASLNGMKPVCHTKIGYSNTSAGRAAWACF
jgi:hypothetical protein